MNSMSPEEAAQRQARRQVDLDSWRDINPDAEAPLTVEQVLDDQARNRSRVDRAFGAAWSLLAAGFKVLPLNQTGRPLAGAEPVAETALLMATWDDHPTALAGAACGSAHDLVAAAVTDDGYEWLRGVSVDPNTRRRPPAEPPVAASVEPYAEPGQPRPGPQARELFGVAVRLVEVQHAPPRLASATTAPGERGRSWGEDLAGKLRRPKPATSTILVWSWPPAEGDKAWTLPVGRRVRAGVELPAAIPADGSVLEVDGRHWRVSWGSGLARRLPLPSWLASELGGRLRAP